MSTPKATALPISVELVASELPASPLILVTGETAAIIASLESEARTLVIHDPASADEAAACFREANGLLKELDATRLKLKRPFMDWEDRIDQAAKAPLAALRAAVASVKPKIAKWQDDCEARARAEEAKRQAAIRAAEAARIAAEQAAAKAEADRLAAIEAAKLAAAKAKAEAEARPTVTGAMQAGLEAAFSAPVEASDFDDFDFVAADVQAEAAQVNAAKVAAASVEIQQTRAIIAPRPAGVGFRKTLKVAVTDVGRLPSHLVIVTANDAAIRAQFVTGWKAGDPVPSFPGLSFTVETQTIDNARR